MHAVEEYLYEYVGENVEILETADVVYIGDDFPKEVKGSEDTRRLKGTNAKYWWYRFTSSIVKLK